MISASLHTPWCDVLHGQDDPCASGPVQVIPGVHAWVTAAFDGKPVVVVDQDRRYDELPLQQSAGTEGSGQG